MAPELVRKHEYDGKKVDMWAIGVLLYTLLAGTFPFRGQSEAELFNKIQRGYLNFKTPHESMSKQARAIIHKLLEVDQRKRMRATELLNLEWI
jgi:serine/threonine protein kinase